jgi:hypothetical protein
MSGLWNYLDRRAVALSDGVVTAATLLLAGLLAIWLDGCAEIGQLSADDAKAATTIAAAVGDTAAAACWPILETTGNAISAAGNSPGVLVAIEEKRAIRIALQNSECQPVWAGVLAQLLKATPAGPFVP